MIDIVDTLERWRQLGLDFALATVTKVENSAPRAPGSAMAVNVRGEAAGSVSGGCVESALYVEAQDALRTRRAREVTYGISDDEAISHGLTCGGTIHIAVIPYSAADPLIARLIDDVRAQRPAAYVLRLDDEGCGRRLLIDEAGIAGALGTKSLEYAAEAEARALLFAAETRVRAFGDEGEPNGDDVRVFVQSFAPKADLYIFGAIDFSRAMATMGKYLGYRVTVVDARPVFATKARVPDADEVVVEWPDEFLRKARVDERTALVVLTHDEKFDIPLLRVALRTKAGYIGVMGSRRTHANRITSLREIGFGDADLARLHAPVGLDLGARTPEETSVSIAAEMIASRSGRRGGALREGSLPIHPEANNAATA